MKKFITVIAIINIVLIATAFLVQWFIQELNWEQKDFFIASGALLINAWCLWVWNCKPNKTRSSDKNCDCDKSTKPSGNMR